MPCSYWLFGARCLLLIGWLGEQANLLLEQGLIAEFCEPKMERKWAATKGGLVS